MVRDRARRVARGAGRRAWRGIVWLITTRMFLQALLTGSVVGMITGYGEAVGVYVSRTLQTVAGVYIPAQGVLGIIFTAAFAFAFWANQHIEEWREMVEDTTGAEAADAADDPAE